MPLFGYLGMHLCMIYFVSNNEVPPLAIHPKGITRVPSGLSINDDNSSSLMYTEALILLLDHVHSPADN